MEFEPVRVSGRTAVLAAAGDHPYVRLTTGGPGAVTGYLLDGTIAWTAAGPWGPVACAQGDPETAARLFADLARTDALGGAGWLHLPRVPADVLAPHLTVTQRDDWDFRWAVDAPPPQPGEDRVVPLADADRDAINALLDETFPSTTTRPGDPRVRSWYGIWARDRLVACGADRSRGGIGFLAGLTVATDTQGQGLGAALTAAMTRRLLDHFEAVTLGVMIDNCRATRLYERLGFLGSLARSSVAIADRPPSHHVEQRRAAPPSDDPRRPMLTDPR